MHVFGGDPLGGWWRIGETYPSQNEDPLDIATIVKTNKTTSPWVAGIRAVPSTEAIHTVLFGLFIFFGDSFDDGNIAETHRWISCFMLNSLYLVRTRLTSRFGRTSKDIHSDRDIHTNTCLRRSKGRRKNERSTDAQKSRQVLHKMRKDRTCEHTACDARGVEEGIKECWETYLTTPACDSRYPYRTYRCMWQERQPNSDGGTKREVDRDSIMIKIRNWCGYYRAVSIWCRRNWWLVIHHIVVIRISWSEICRMPMIQNHCFSLTPNLFLKIASLVRTFEVLTCPMLSLVRSLNLILIVFFRLIPCTIFFPLSV